MTHRRDTASRRPAPRRPSEPSVALPSPPRAHQNAPLPRERAPQPAPAVAGQAPPPGLPTLQVSADLASALANGHPWIYRDHLPQALDVEPGTWVRIVSGGWSGIGICDPGSALAVRMYSREQVPDAAWFSASVQRAKRRRAPLLEDGATTAYRLLNGEGDGLPGIVVDVYGPIAVLRLDSAVLVKLVPWIVDAVQSHVEVKGICQKTTAGLEILSGRPPPDRLVVSEHGLRFFADIGSGQKTGLFLDHRENRQAVERWARDKTVLNLFSYTGGFSLYAARGGARRVTSVDRAPDAMARARDNVELNGFDPEIFEFVTGDAMLHLEQLGREGKRFDIVISDPPSFARNRMQRQRALRAYERLHTLALGVLAPGGLFAAASCTSQVDSEAFKATVAKAAARLERPLQIVMEAGQAIDHPVMLGHPEGRYLKFVALRSTSD
jgi:23S rRNA (cytosine1962-C5)-methyltransferase